MEKDGISMFCPKCGQLLLLKENEERGSELYCVKGDMGLSQVIRQKFEERYGLSLPRFRRVTSGES